MNLTQALALNKGDAVAFVGGGGKTTTMLRLAGELAAVNRRVIVTTTTKIYRPDPSVCPTAFWAEQIERINFHDSTKILTVGAGILPHQKLEGLLPQAVDELINAHVAQHVLVEADGSRGLSFKTPAAQEPVLPDNINVVVIVTGLDILGQRLSAQTVHRPELVARQGAIKLGQVIDENTVARVLTHPQGYLSRIAPGAKLVYLLNKTDLRPWRQVLLLADLLKKQGASIVVAGATGKQNADIGVV